MAGLSGSGEYLPLIISIGTIQVDVLINLLCNDISKEVQQDSSLLVTRFTPYLVWLTITVCWILFKRGTRQVSRLRRYEPVMVFVGTVLLDVLINLLCSDISGEVWQQTFMGERFLPYAVLFTTAVLWFVVKRMMETWQLETRQPKSPEASTPQGIFQLNDSVWELHAPNDGIPEVDIILFHGLPSDDSKDSLWKTWLARDTDQLVWPKEWLGKAYPNARIVSISYHHSLAATKAREHGELDMHALQRNLVKDIILAKHLNIGQNCPVILIGHCLGGIVIEGLLNTAVNMKRTAIQPITSRLNSFVGNIRGVFYYALPHGPRSRISELAEQIPSKNRTLEFLKTIAAQRLEIKEEFRQQHTELLARSFAVLEGRKTKYLGFDHMVAGEASIRHEVNRSYIDTTADHFAVCRPTSSEATTYKILVQFIVAALADGMIRQYAGCK